MTPQQRRTENYRRELLIAVAAGNERAYGLLYDQLADETWQACVRHLGGHEVAREAMQKFWSYVWTDAAKLSAAAEKDSVHGVILSATLTAAWAHGIRHDTLEPLGAKAAF